MPASELKTSELAILTRILEPDKPLLSAAAARSVLEFAFGESDKQRMHQLAVKAQEGSLTAIEKEAINTYERVGNLLNLLHAKARITLKNRRAANGKAKAH